MGFGNASTATSESLGISFRCFPHDGTCGNLFASDLSQTAASRRSGSALSYMHALRNGGM
jgi:hypothetical protein